MLAQQLWLRLAGPYWFKPLLHPPGGEAMAAGWCTRSLWPQPPWRVNAAVLNPVRPSRARRPSRADADAGPEPPALKLPTALYILERIFQLVMHPPLLHNILLVLLAPPHATPPTPTHHASPTDAPSPAHAPSPAPWAVPAANAPPPPPATPTCRHALAAHMATHAPLVASAAVRLLVAVTQCSALAPDLLAALDLRPSCPTLSPAPAPALSPAPAPSPLQHSPCGAVAVAQQLAAERAACPAGPAVATQPVHVAPAHAVRFGYYTAWSTTLPPALPPAPRITADDAPPPPPLPLPQHHNLQQGEVQGRGGAGGHGEQQGAGVASSTGDLLGLDSPPRVLQPQPAGPDAGAGCSDPLGACALDEEGGAQECAGASSSGGPSPRMRGSLTAGAACNGDSSSSGSSAGGAAGGEEGLEALVHKLVDEVVESIVRQHLGEEPSGSGLAAGPGGGAGGGWPAGRGSGSGRGGEERSSAGPVAEGLETAGAAVEDAGRDGGAQGEAGQCSSIHGAGAAAVGPPPLPAALDLVEVVIGLLAAPQLPPSVLWHAAVLMRTWLGVQLPPPPPPPPPSQQQQWINQQQAPQHAPPASPSPSTTQPPGPWACTVSAAQRSALGRAVHAALHAALLELDGMWCEAIFTLLCLEWPVAAAAITRPSLRAASDALMDGPHLHPTPPAPPGAPPTAANATGRHLGLGASAAAALRTHLAVQRLVALLQLLGVLREGRPSTQPPVPHIPDLKQRVLDVTEGQQVHMNAVRGRGWGVGKRGAAQGPWSAEGCVP